jgi:hypothetical protein
LLGFEPAITPLPQKNKLRMSSAECVQFLGILQKMEVAPPERISKNSHFGHVSQQLFVALIGIGN